jgi:hypothetical protein
MNQVRFDSDSIHMEWTACMAFAICSAVRAIAVLGIVTRETLQGVFQRFRYSPHRRKPRRSNVSGLQQRNHGSHAV